jgi:hypothetical protein
MSIDLIKELFGYAWADFREFLNAREMCGDNVNEESDFVFGAMLAMLED